MGKFSGKNLMQKWSRSNAAIAKQWRMIRIIKYKTWHNTTTGKQLREPVKGVVSCVKFNLYKNLKRKTPDNKWLCIQNTVGEEKTKTTNCNGWSQQQVQYERFPMEIIFCFCPSLLQSLKRECPVLNNEMISHFCWQH